MQLSEEEYRKKFINSTAKDEVINKQKEALERAWKNRDFEIELYWKRATYFWSFIAAAFAGYFIVVKSDVKFIQAEYIIICLGFIFSIAWYFVNIGSKKWQENWEKHIDMLEDEITGPIYKVVLDKTSYSVSEVNILVSQYVSFIWFILGINYWINHVTFNGSFNDLDIILIVLTIITFVYIILLLRKKNDPKNVVNKQKENIEKFSFSL